MFARARNSVKNIKLEFLLVNLYSFCFNLHIDPNINYGCIPENNLSQKLYYNDPFFLWTNNVKEMKSGTKKKRVSRIKT